eukprot:c23061_g1_i2 orf=224-1060(+)
MQIMSNSSIMTFGGFCGTQIRGPSSHLLHAQKLLFSVNCVQEDVGVNQASSLEPKWKQKLAAADDFAERTRQRTLHAQEEYKQRQAALQRIQGGASREVIPLRDLEFLPYLNEDGLIMDCSEPNAKASVYAIFDNDKVLQYIGISRQVYSSMRLHFARVPLKCYYVKIQNISKPSRSLLELIKERWIEESGFIPCGNDSGPEQNVWENPLDCKPLMTDEETHKFEEAGAGPPKGKVLKNVARRVEAELEENFKARNCKERLRFDPKLKEKGLLDLKNI